MHHQKKAETKNINLKYTQRNRVRLSVTNLVYRQLFELLTMNRTAGALHSLTSVTNLCDRCKRMKSTSRSIHRKKLEKLTINQIGAVKDSGLITNLSSYSLDLSEKLVLSRGLNFAYPSKSDDVAIKSEFESCFYRLQKDVDATKHNEFLNGLGDLAYQYSVDVEVREFSDPQTAK